MEEQQATFSIVGASRLIDEVSVELAGTVATASVCHQDGQIVGITDGKIKTSDIVRGSFAMGGLMPGAGGGLTVSVYDQSLTLQQRAEALRAVAALVGNVESHLTAK